MNSLTISRTTGKNVRARALVTKFFVGEKFQYGIPGRRCAQIVESFGDNSSYSLSDAPLKEILGAGKWNQGGTVALSTNGPAGKIKIFSRACSGIYDNGKFVPLVNGWVIDIGHHLRADSCSWKVFDDRHIMTKYTCKGQMVVEKSGTGFLHYYRSNPNDSMTFNRDGHGDMIRFAGGYRFSTGRRVGQVVSADSSGDDYPGSAGSTTTSGLWRCSQIIEYLRTFFWDTGSRPALGQDYGDMQLPKSIKWPKGLGSKLKYDRTPTNMELEGLDLLSALRRVVQYAGPYDIHLAPINEQESELQIIDFNPTDKVGSYMYTAKYTGASLDECMSNPSIIWDGVITESGNKTFPGGIALCLDAPSTELMASTDTSGSLGDDGNAAHGYLEEGWTSSELSAWKAEMEKLSANQYVVANFNKASERFPNVLSWYKVAAARNPFATTKWARLPAIGSMRIKTNQLTCYNENANSPIGLVARENVIEHKLEYHEYSILDDYGKARGYWRLAGKYPGLQISPCGRYIQKPGLRDGLSPEGKQGTWYVNEGGPNGPYDADYIQPRRMRMQLAVEHNQCMVVRAGKSERDPTGTLHRVDKGAPKFSLLIPSAPGSYIDWTRTGFSFPCGRGGITSTEYAALGWASLFPAKQTAGNELMTDNIGDGNLNNAKNRAPIHAEIHVNNFKKVDYQGILEFAQLTAAWRVGRQITVETEAVVAKVSGIIRCVTWSDATNHTQVEFGPNDIGAIYDGPIQISSGMNGSGASGGGGDTSNGGGDSPTTTPSGGGSSGGDSPGVSTQPIYDKPLPAPRAATSSDNDSDANNSAIRNNPTAGGGISGNVGAISMARNGGGRRNQYLGSEPGQAAASRGSRGTIRGESELRSEDALRKEVGSLGSKKSIYTGDQLKDRDDAMFNRTTEYDDFGNMTRMGGVRDQFRPKSQDPFSKSLSSSDQARMAKGFGPEQTRSQETRRKNEFNADVARGFNPNGAVMPGQSSRARAAAKPVKPYESSESWERRKARVIGQ